jgi:short-subunit dehydrogenase
MSVRWAVVTGAGSGIGHSIARELRARGFDLLACSLHEDELVSLDDGARRPLLERVGADLSDERGVRALCSKIEELSDTPEILVNCAGLGAFGPHLELDPSRVAAMVAVNIGALTALTTYVARRMVTRKRGRVLNVASTAAFQPVPQFAVYAASKHYVRAFSEALAEELDGTGVTVSVLYPGPTNTAFLEAAGFPADGPTGSLGSIVKRALLEPDDVARAGIDGMLRGDRSIVLGPLNKLQRVLSQALPERASMALWRVMTRPR